MSQRYFRIVFLGSASLFVLGVSNLPAQYAKPPDAYSLTETNSLMVPNQVVKIYRDGNKVITDEITPRSGEMPHAIHTRDLLNLETHQDRTWDLGDASAPCGLSTQGGSPGDWSGNPFEWLSGMFGDDVSKMRQVGTDTVAGMKAKVLEANGPGGQKAKVWVDEKYGLMLKMATTGKNGQDETQLEVKSFTGGKPPASVFVMPASCEKSQTVAPASTGENVGEAADSKRIAAETGGDAKDYLLATNQNAPSSANSCTVLFRVVQADTMAPITYGFKIGLGLKNPDAGNPPDVTSQFKNGILRIQNPPPRFSISYDFGNGGGGMASFPRQCFRPQTVLLLVIKNVADVTEGSDLLWVKSGKYATVAASAQRSSGAVYVGCYSDQGTRDLPEAFTDVPNMTNATCQAICQSKGFTYAGTQYASQCFCGNTYGKYGRLPEAKCDMPCSGNSGEKCGGTWANSVFKVKP